MDFLCLRFERGSSSDLPLFCVRKWDAACGFGCDSAARKPTL